MSKKKPEQKKQIVPIFQKGLFWVYQSYPKQSIEKLDNFLTSFNQELKSLIDQSKSFQQNYQIICSKVIIDIHPSLQSKFHNEKPNSSKVENNNYGDKYITFLSHKIDIITLKVFCFIASQYKLNTIKFSNNSFSCQQATEIQKFLDKQDSLTTLFFQWNPLLQLQIRKDVILSCARPSLVHLILRQCQMGDIIFKQLINKIIGFTQPKLKSLDLYGNNLSSDIKDELCTYIQTNKIIQFIGLSKNKLNSQQLLTRLFNSFGEIKLTDKQYDDHKLKQKIKEQTTQRNKKRKKGTPQQPLPFMFELKQTIEGKFYIKNTSIKILNISFNQIGDQSVPLIRKFAEKNGKHIELFIQGNKFSKANKDSLKFFQNVI